MQFQKFLVFSALSLALAGCNAMTPTGVADLACLGAETSSTIALVATTDIAGSANAVGKSAAAQKTATAIHQSVSDVCPILTGGVAAMSAAIAQSGSSK